MWPEEMWEIYVGSVGCRISAAGDVAVSSAPTALIESIHKAYKMRLFVNENNVKAKAFGVPPRTLMGSFQRSLNPLADVIGCNSCEVLNSL